MVKTCRVIVRTMSRALPGSQGISRRGHVDLAWIGLGRFWPAWPRFRTIQVCDQSGCESIGPDDYTGFSAMLLALLLFAAYARLPGVRRPLFEWIDIKCQDWRGGATKQPAMVRGWGFSKAEWWAPRKIGPTRRTPQNCPRMIPFRSRSDSLTF